MNGATRLDLYQNKEYNSGPLIKRTFWHFTSMVFFQSRLPYPNWMKRGILRLFGASIGTGVVIKPSVTIKQPWRLQIGNWSWIGEQVWIDNLGQVNIGDHCCVSQGALLLCGNHNYNSITFDLMVGEITLEDGVWIGAQVLVNPDTICKSHSVAISRSVITKEMQAFHVYGGNPAKIIRCRNLKQG